MRNQAVVELKGKPLAGYDAKSLTKIQQKQISNFYTTEQMQKLKKYKQQTLNISKQMLGNLCQ